jgi:hypothetical protein
MFIPFFIHFYKQQKFNYLDIITFAIETIENNNFLKYTQL